MAERYSQGALNWHSHGILCISSNGDLRRIFWGLKFSIWDFFVSENLARVIVIIIYFRGGWGRRVASLHRRLNLTSVGNVCEVAPKSLFCAPNGLNQSPEMGFEFRFILIGQSTMVF